MTGNKRNQPSWLRFSGVGIEFAAAVGGFGIVGYWIDLHYGCEPWCVLIGVALGLTGGTYNLLRESRGLFKPPKPPDQRDDEGQQRRT